MKLRESSLGCRQCGGRATPSRRLVAPLAAVLAVSMLSGCGLNLPNIVRNLSKTPIENTVPKIGGAVAELQGVSGWSATKQSAAADLSQAGLDFACVFPIDDIATNIDTRVKDELLRRQVESANAGLADIAAEYEYAYQPDVSLTETQYLVAGLYTLGTYCNFDTALEGF